MDVQPIIVLGALRTVQFDIYDCCQEGMMGLQSYCPIRPNIQDHTQGVGIDQAVIGLREQSWAHVVHWLCGEIAIRD